MMTVSLECTNHSISVLNKTFEANQTFRLTGFKVSQIEWPEEILISYHLTEFISKNETLDKIHC